MGPTRTRSRLLPLEPLTGDESAQVIANLLGTSSFDDMVRQRIIESAQGNPLFVEQMLSMLLDDGLLSRGIDGAWTVTGDLMEVIVPPSISALLSARLDRLANSERGVLERASIIGRVFWPVAVIALGESSAAVDEPIGGSTQAARRADDSWFEDEAAYKFLHILIRDETYSGILKRRRADLHERFADWMLASAGIRVDEQREIIGYHFEQSVEYRRELGPLDERGQGLAWRASEQLGLAGRRAFNRGDMPAAGNLLRRAADILPVEDPARGGLLLGAGEALSDAGRFAEAEAALAESVASAAAHGDRSLETTASIVRLHLHFASEGGDASAVRAQTEEAIAILEAAGDDAGLARAWRLMNLIGLTVGKLAEAERAAVKSIEHAKRTGDDVMVRRNVGVLASAIIFGPSPVDRGIELADELLESAGDDTRSQGVVLGALAQLHSMIGEFDLARDRYRRSRAVFEEHGWNFFAALVSLDSGQVELPQGRPPAAPPGRSRATPARQRSSSRAPRRRRGCADTDRGRGRTRRPSSGVGPGRRARRPAIGCHHPRCRGARRPARCRDRLDSGRR